MKIVVDGIELTVKQTLQSGRVYVSVKRVTNLPTARCTCDYRYGFSDHAEHCQSIYKASDPGGYYDDD
jgi:hypothetical protein